MPDDCKLERFIIGLVKEDWYGVGLIDGVWIGLRIGIIKIDKWSMFDFVFARAFSVVKIHTTNNLAHKTVDARKLLIVSVEIDLFFKAL